MRGRGSVVGVETGQGLDGRVGVSASVQTVSGGPPSLLCNGKGRGKGVPLQARRGPEGSRKLRFPDYVTTAQVSGRLSALRTGCLYPQEILLVLISVKRLSRPQGHSAIGRILCQ